VPDEPRDGSLTPIGDALGRLEHEGLGVDVQATEHDQQVMAEGRIDLGKRDEFTIGGRAGWIRSKGWQIAAYFGWTPKPKEKG